MTTIMDVINERNERLYKDLGRKLAKGNKIRGIDLPTIIKTLNDEQNYKLSKILDMSLYEMILLFIKNIDNIQLGKETLFCTKDKKLYIPNHSCSGFEKALYIDEKRTISKYMICLNCSHEKNNKKINKI